MKLTKKISAIIACSAIMFNSITAVCASAANDDNNSEVNISEVTDYGMIEQGECVGLTSDPDYLNEELYNSGNIGETGEINGQNRPTSVWDFSNSSLYYFDGSATYTDLYTNYLFTGTTNMGIYVTNESNSTLNFKVYKKTATILTDYAVASFSVSPNATAYKVASGLSSGSKYYIKFSCPCSVNGYVAG